jgi:hypothetical protein
VWTAIIPIPRIPLATAIMPLPRGPYAFTVIHSIMDARTAIIVSPLIWPATATTEILSVLPAIPPNVRITIWGVQDVILRTFVIPLVSYAIMRSLDIPATTVIRLSRIMKPAIAQT